MSTIQGRHALSVYEGEFTLRGTDGEPFRVRWHREATTNMSAPAPRISGISGWAKCDDELIRVHVCAHCTCQADFAPNKYGKLPPPRHGHYMYRSSPPRVTPAVAGSAQAPPPHPSPATAAPEAAPPQPTATPAAPASTAVAGIAKAASPAAPAPDSAPSATDTNTHLTQPPQTKD